MIPREFYSKDTITVARNILGKRIIRKIGRTELSGIITETEAYRHTDDPASHAFGRKTDRNKVMFEDVGHAYVYFTYGMHYCFNVVARHPKIKAGAVLIRAIKPEKGIEKMQKNRKIANTKDLTNGPAKLTQALEITKEHYGIDLTKDSRLHIAEGIKPKKIIASPRIGIKNATDKLWNFKIDI
ncbi:putative 3-methyladenine DNA glycosylase [Nitrosopumilus zosterae]|uniref:Putative 3-methyladenine DNA glycosylase n=1 Tax=Nitrosopumilus zosterae TaxID=718286 RepID=A0A2S2KT86_9ARCH|nr:DNA-3-methyladenine glycosylase [Nitrosopumilus zosterae]BDQ30711.1 DNA-3-methyladenine glycosylase [Nitrosopumilus zosterae]GBH34675.1 putative 3-methyladenine DNA glycosylase [Nitrosopumilus zosterae]